MTRRSAVDAGGGAQPSAEEFSIARQVIKKSGLVAALAASQMTKPPSRTSSRGVL